MERLLAARLAKEGEILGLLHEGAQGKGGGRATLTRLHRLCPEKPNQPAVEEQKFHPASGSIAAWRSHQLKSERLSVFSLLVGLHSGMAFRKEVS